MWSVYIDVRQVGDPQGGERPGGYHLILATQQPRTQVITSAVRALIPAKVVLRVTSALESRVALEEVGAERLLGNGDLLFKCIGTKRLQSAWLPADEEAGVVATASSWAR